MPEYNIASFIQRRNRSQRRLPRLLLCLSDTGCKAIPPLPNQWSSLLSLPGIPYIPAPSCPSSLWYSPHEPHSFPWPNLRQQKPAQAYPFRMSLSCPHTHRRRSMRENGISSLSRTISPSAVSLIQRLIHGFGRSFYITSKGITWFISLFSFIDATALFRLYSPF